MDSTALTSAPGIEEDAAVRIAREALSCIGDESILKMARYIVQHADAREEARRAIPTIVADARAWLDLPAGHDLSAPGVDSWRFARALIIAHESNVETSTENANLRDYIASAKECATAAAMLEMHEENERIRKTVTDLVEKLEGGAKEILAGLCAYCSERWILADGTADELRARSVAHAKICTENPMRNELAELRARVDVFETDARKAAGELLVSLTEMPPGSTLRRVVSANAIIRQERDRVRAEARELDAALVLARSERDELAIVSALPPDERNLVGVNSILRMERDAARAEVERWQNCVICIDCGRCKYDEDGLCSTCGRDVLGFENGKLAHKELADHFDGIEKAGEQDRKELDASRLELSQLQTDYNALAMTIFGERDEIPNNPSAIREVQRMHEIVTLAIGWNGRSPGRGGGSAEIALVRACDEWRADHRCDECDPSFGCFADPAKCRKVPQP